MSRSLTAALSTALLSDHVRPIVLFKVNTSTGDLLVWSGQGTLSWNGDLYAGMGEFIGVSAISESSTLGAQGLSLSLSGVSPTNVAIAVSQIQHNRLATIWMAVLDIVTGLLVADPYQMFQGYTDVPSIKDNGATSTIIVTIENKMIDLQRPRTRRYTSEDQHIDWPDDTGFDYVPELQDTAIIWAGSDVSFAE